MSDLKKALDARRADLTPDPGGFERLVRRRRRNEVRGRVVAGVVAVVVVAGGFLTASSIWGGSRHVPAGGVPLSPSSAGTLAVGWTAHVGGSATAPIAADGLVFVGASSGTNHLYAFPQVCGRSCRPRWVGDTGSGLPTSAPVELDGVVFVSSDRLYAFDVHCGTAGETCRPLWVSSRFVRPDGLSAPVVDEGRVYVENGGHLYGFAPRCAAGGSLCFARPVGSAGGRQDTGQLVAGEGLIYVRWSHDSVAAFTARCSTGSCPPRWNIRGVPGPDTALNLPLAVAGGILYVGANAYGADCGDHGRCAPQWVAGVDRATHADNNAPVINGTAVSNGTVYMSAHRLYAFPEACATGGSTCPPAWFGPRQFDPAISGYRAWSAPTVVDGLVFASTDRPYAFAAVCAHGGTCRPLWAGPASPGVTVSSVAVAGNRAFATSASGTVWGFQAMSAG